MKGLTYKQVNELKIKGLYNKAPAKTTKSFFRILFDNLFTYFNIINILLFMLIAFTGELKNGLFIGVLVTNTITGIIQEVRAKRILDKLSVVNETDVSVIREGNEEKISFEDVVLGDIIHFYKGEQVCVDCKVLECNGLSVDESMLTGENKPVTKIENDKLFSGSFVSSGECFAVAETVGEQCYSAIITARAKQRKKIKSQILSDVEKVVRIMSFIIIPCGILLFLSQMFLAELNIKTNLTATVASMIGMIPNGLVLLITAAYSLGIYRVFKKGALSQESAVIEVLSDMDVMCFDKTGTITLPGTNTVRKEIPEFISFLYKNNIDIKLISGDAPEYVLEAANKSGIKKPEKIANLSGMNESETMKAAIEYNIFCKATPEQKHLIIKSIKENGKKCCMAGDGVNDIMALKEADCSVAPVSGTDSAKGVAGVILMNSDFSVLEYAFYEGRRAVNNLSKTACLYFNKTVYSLILTLFTILFSAISDTKYPFEPIQTTAISVFAVGIPSVLITLQCNTQKLSCGFLKFVLRNAIPFGVSVAIGIISLTIASKFSLIDVNELPFASYALAGIVAFTLLFFCGKPHTKFSLVSLFVLFCGFITTFFYRNFFALGIINATSVLSAVAGIIIAFFVLIFIKKTVKF